MCWYLNGRKCSISCLLVLRDHATLGKKEFVFIAHGTVAHKETMESYDCKTSHFEKIITYQENMTVP